MISIIVPIYNIEKYLKNCLNSLICQSSENIEFILVDDGSRDKCPSICNEYALADKRIRVIHKENGGLVSARIAGLNASYGNYIIFVDGDDWVDNYLIERVESVLRKHKNIDLLCFGANYIYRDSCIQHQVSIPSGLYERHEIEDLIFPKLIENEYGKTFDTSIWGKVFRKDLLLECYKNMYLDITLGEDGAITRPYIYKCNSIIIMDNYLYNYNKTNQLSMTSALKPIRWENAWLIRDVYIRTFNYNSDWKYQINRNTVHNLFTTSISQFNTSKSFFEVSKDIKKNLSNNKIKEICNNTYYKKLKFKGGVFAVKYKLTIFMYLYWRSLK